MNPNTDWLSVYFNKNNETNIYIRETHFINTGGNTDFWKQAAYHRVFGLYVIRRSKNVVLDGRNSIRYTVFASSMTVHKTTDWHRYALYYRYNYPCRTFGTFYDHNNRSQSYTIRNKNYELDENYCFYQSITSMMIIGGQKLVSNAATTRSISSSSSSSQKLPINETQMYLIIKHYFQQSARKQLGQHIFIGEDGELISIRLFFYPMTAAAATKTTHRRRSRQQSGQSSSNRVHVFDVSPTSTIAAIYPTIRNEWWYEQYSQTQQKVVWRETSRPQQLTQQTFTMGLLFRRFGNNGESLTSYIRRNGWLYYSKKYWDQQTNYNTHIEPFGRLDHRLYKRFTGEMIQCYAAGVYELTEQLFKVIHNQYNNNNNSGQVAGGAVGGVQQTTTATNNGQRFAVYVCAGARLVVQDNYDESIENIHHNRTLFEQGSVVIVEDQLYMTVPYDTGVTDFMNSILLDWPEFCDQYLNDYYMKDRVKGYRNPVVFLGAHESDYNTSVWCLTVEKLSKKIDTKILSNNDEFVTYERRCYLNIPEGAYIVAVEDWEDGMDEIWKRHQYEQLHRAIVEHHVPDAPYYVRPAQYASLTDGNNKYWPQKIILNTCREFPMGRHIYIDIVGKTPEIADAYRELYDELGQQFQPDIHSIHPREFNFRQFIYTDQMLPNIKAYTASPPAYPPVILTDRTGGNIRLYYLPQTLQFQAEYGTDTSPIGGPIVNMDCNLLTVFKKYAINPVTYSTIEGQTYIQPTDNISPILVLRDGERRLLLPEYQWKRLPNPFVNKHQLFNCDDYRLAIDGHFYQKTNPNRIIGKVLSAFYEVVDKHTGNALAVDIVPNDPNFGQQSDNSFREITDNQLANLDKTNPFLPNPKPKQSGKSGRSSGRGGKSIKSANSGATSGYPTGDGGSTSGYQSRNVGGSSGHRTRDVGGGGKRYQYQDGKGGKGGGGRPK